MLVPISVQSVGLDPKDSTPVVVLREIGGTRALPIWIGPSEAAAIAVRLTDKKFDRPLTHDLLANVISGFGGHLTQVVINHDGKTLYLAEVVIHRGSEIVKFDARPSDAIAVALRLNAEILVYEHLLAPAPGSSPET
jgi:bifunctional DNase/RNase